MMSVSDNDGLYSNLEPDGLKRPYLCPDTWCKFARDGFKRKDNLKRHIQNAHPGYYDDRS